MPVVRGQANRLAALAAVGLAAAGLAPAAAARRPRGPACGVPAVSRTASPWPSMRHDLHNTGAGSTPADYHGDRPWSFATGAGLFITPVIAGNGLVYFGSADHYFYAVTPAGKLCWRLRTGNIIDAAATLDPAQRTVTIGSADEYLYHLSASPRARHRVIWRYHATLAPAAGQLVDWWEDDIAYGPDGNVYTGNTGGVIYSFTPQGRLRWTFRAGNSVWTMPAFAPDGTTYWGSVDRSIYALAPDGSQKWSTPTLGFVISSPALGSDGTLYVGSFDSKLYALDPATGASKWTFGTNDHIYSSPALGVDARGRTAEIYFASTDGSVYALDPSGKLLWSYDTGEPIRSSPVLGPGPGGRGRILYVGSSDGSLYALDAGTGARRWSFDTVSSDPILRDRHELNSSPALGSTGVYIGSEDGRVSYVPYDYCLHRADVRCNTDPGSPYAANLNRVLPVTAGGTTQHLGSEGPLPASSELTGRLIVRRSGRTVYASMLPVPSTAALIHTSPSFSYSAQLSGDGRFVFITPTSFLAPDSSYRVAVAGTWGAGATRVANYGAPGTWTSYGPFHDTFSFRTAAPSGPLPLRNRARRVSAFLIRRLAVPLPAFLPSVNQIGFDSYVLLVGAVSVGAPDASGQGSILLWATQARRGSDGRYLVDPAGTLIFPLAGTYRGSTLMLSVHGATLTFSFGKVPLQTLDLGFGLSPSLHNLPGASLYAEAVCAQIPNYGPAVYITGICNTNGILPAAGTFITDPYRAPAPTRRAPVSPANLKPSGVSVDSVSYQPPTQATAGSVKVSLRLARGIRYPAGLHRLGVLLVDGSDQPLGIDYSAQSTATDGQGNIRQVTLTIPAGTAMPSRLAAYVIADLFPLARRSLS